MKPKVYQVQLSDFGGKALPNEWWVDFEDTCGCPETEWFSRWSRALDFANRIAAGVDRWHA